MQLWSGLARRHYFQFSLGEDDEQAIERGRGIAVAGTAVKSREVGADFLGFKPSPRLITDRAYSRSILHVQFGVAVAERAFDNFLAEVADSALGTEQRDGDVVERYVR